MTSIRPLCSQLWLYRGSQVTDGLIQNLSHHFAQFKIKLKSSETVKRLILQLYDFVCISYVGQLVRSDFPPAVESVSILSHIIDDRKSLTSLIIDTYNLNQTELDSHSEIFQLIEDVLSAEEGFMQIYFKRIYDLFENLNTEHQVSSATISGQSVIQKILSIRQDQLSSRRRNSIFNNYKHVISEYKSSAEHKRAESFKLKDSIISHIKRPSQQHVTNSISPNSNTKLKLQLRLNKTKQQLQTFLKQLKDR